MKKFLIQIFFLKSYITRYKILCQSNTYKKAQEKVQIEALKKPILKGRYTCYIILYPPTTKQITAHGSVDRVKKQKKTIDKH